ncbi:MAG: hypothetical protein C0425_11410 [Chlorobiaceae bacterium]|nr:hypothetical protein [Chlorobiaceae bacterium]
MKNNINVAVDIGNTRLKLGVFEGVQPLKLQIFEMKDLKKEFETPSGFKEWFIEVFQKFDIRPEQLAFSISGIVDHEKNTLVKSNILGKKFDGCNFATLFWPIRTHLYNDGVSSSLSYLYSAEKENLPFPCLCISLGTGVAISVIDCTSPNNYAIYSFEYWGSKIKIHTRDGFIPLLEALGAKALREKMREPDSYTFRVIRAIHAILIEYKGRFNWQPTALLINGGGVANIDFGRIEKTFSQIIFCYSKDDNEQITNTLLGVLRYPRHGTILNFYNEL